MPNAKRAESKHKVCAKCGGYDSHHPVRHVELSDEYGVCVDEELANLVQLVNRRGATTVSACQGDPGMMASIDFPESSDLTYFLHLVSEIAEPKALARIAACDTHAQAWQSPENPWKASVLIACQFDLRPEMTLDKGRSRTLRDGYTLWTDYVSVEFPKSDIGWLEAGLRSL